MIKGTWWPAAGWALLGLSPGIMKITLLGAAVKQSLAAGGWGRGDESLPGEHLLCIMPLAGVL